MSVESDLLKDSLENYPAAENPSDSELAEMDPVCDSDSPSPEGGADPESEQAGPDDDVVPAPMAASAPRAAAAPLASPEPLVAVDPLVNIKIQIDPETLDDAGYVSIWNVASATVSGDTVLARAVASRLLGFLCKHQCDFVVTSSTDARYLDEWYERDQGLLNDWAPTSEKVDVLSQHAQVPGQALLRLLRQKGFDPTKVYSPKRADRAKWFTDGWSIG